MDAEYFHNQALRCYRLARQCYELSVAEELNELGDELQARAREFHGNGSESRSRAREGVARQ
jgi:hypothetical protein